MVKSTFENVGVVQLKNRYIHKGCFFCIVKTAGNGLFLNKAITIDIPFYLSYGCMYLCIYTYLPLDISYMQLHVLAILFIDNIWQKNKLAS
jgi:hypothetical protein